METYKCIISRRSIRNYNQKKITKKDFINLIKAASMAPSGGNAQPWYFYIIRNKKIIQKMKNIVLKYQDSVIFAKKYGTFFNASYIISVCVNMDKRWYHSKNYKKVRSEDDVFDNSDYFSVAAAIQNILLSANSINIGTCWCNTSTTYRKKLEKLLNIKPPYRMIANITLGYYNKKTIAPLRQPLKKIFNFVN